MGRDARNFFRRSTDRTDRGPRSTRYAHAVRTIPRGIVSLAPATGQRHRDCGRPLERGFSRRLAACGRFEGRSSASTWLLAIARNKAISARRRRPDVELNEELTSTLADPADDPELMLEKKDREEVLRRSVAQLSQGHAEIIDLVYYHGKSVNEVAEVMDSSGYREDPHVLCAQETGGTRRGSVTAKHAGGLAAGVSLLRRRPR